MPTAIEVETSTQAEQPKLFYVTSLAALEKRIMTDDVPKKVRKFIRVDAECFQSLVRQLLDPTTPPNDVEMAKAGLRRLAWPRLGRKIKRRRIVRDVAVSELRTRDEIKLWVKIRLKQRAVKEGYPHRLPSHEKRRFLAPLIVDANRRLKELRLRPLTVEEFTRQHDTPEQRERRKLRAREIRPD
jgi:hypothetical protein